MADKSIGNASLILGVDAKGLDKGLQEADGKITNFAGKIGGGGSGGAGGAAAAGGPYAMIGMAIVSGLTSAWSSVVGFWNDFSAKAYAVYDGIKAQSKQAMQVGLSTSQFQGFLAGAKVDADTLTVSLGHMSRLISEFGHGSIEAQETFGRLGLTAKDLGGSTSDQFKKVVESIKGLANPADQAAAAFRVFGRSGEEMLPAIRGDLEGATAKAKELGLVFSDEDNAGMKKVSSTWAEVSKITKGIWNQLYAAAVPIFQAIADTVLSAWQVIGPAFRGGVEVIRYFINIVVAVFDTVKEAVVPIIMQLVEMIGVDLTGSVDSAKGMMESFLTGAAQGVGYVLRFYRDFYAFMLDAVGPVFLNIADMAISAMRSIAPAVVAIENVYIGFYNKLIQVFQGIAEKIGSTISWLLDKIASIYESMASLDPTAGMNAKMLRKAQEGANAFKDLVGNEFKIPEIDVTKVDAGLGAMQDKVKQMKDQLPEMVKAMKDADMSPEAIDRFMKGIFDRAKRQGKGAVDEAGNVFNDPQGKNKDKDKFATAGAEGSMDAAKTIYSALYGSAKPDRQVELAQRNNQLQEQQNGLLEKVLDAVKKNGNGLEFGMI